MKSSEIKFFSCKKNTHCYREKTVKIKKMEIMSWELNCIFLGNPLMVFIKFFKQFITKKYLKFKFENTWSYPIYLKVSSNQRMSQGIGLIVNPQQNLLTLKSPGFLVDVQSGGGRIPPPLCFELFDPDFLSKSIKNHIK